MKSPMLAATYHETNPKYVNHIVFPVMASAKIDGIRAFVKDGVVCSRKGLPIPSRAVQHRFGGLEGADGELTYGPSNAPDVRRRSMAVMSPDSIALDDSELAYHIFDRIDLDESYNVRYSTLLRDFYPYALSHATLLNLDELAEFEALTLGHGYEGVMLNDPNAKYKFGRSGKKSPELMKVKRFADDEGVVIGFDELMHNHNEKLEDAFGRAKRQTLKANLVPGGVLGSLRVRVTTGPFVGAEFSLSGFTALQRQELWATRDSLIGRIVSFKHFPHGAKDVPQLPVFQSFRDEGV